MDSHVAPLLGMTKWADSQANLTCALRGAGHRRVPGTVRRIFSYDLNTGE